MTVMVGGYAFMSGTGDEGNETWGWDGAAWTLLCDRGAGCTAPSPRGLAAVTYDSGDQVVRLFGAGADCYESFCASYDDELWEWDGGTWSLVCGGSSGCAGPPARWGGAMAYDPLRARTVLVGGWLSVGSSGAPCPDGSPAGTYGRCVLHDVWEWDGAWTDVTPSGAGPRQHGTVIYDPTRAALLHAGTDELWEWSGGAWAPVALADPENDGAPHDYRGTLAWDAARQRVVRFGFDQETWELDTGARARPGHLFEVDVGAAQAPEAIECLRNPGPGTCSFDQVEVSWWGGGDGGGSAGATLYVWEGGSWAPAVLSTSATAREVTWSTADPKELGRILGGQPDTLTFALAPAVSGSGARGSVTTDCVEVVVRYRN
jgi:hypothetical protein